MQDMKLLRKILKSLNSFQKKFNIWINFYLNFKFKQKVLKQVHFGPASAFSCTAFNSQVDYSLPGDWVWVEK